MTWMSLFRCRVDRILIRKCAAAALCKFKHPPLRHAPAFMQLEFSELNLTKATGAQKLK